ncbi:MAG: aminopeptidase P family protein [Ruminococcus sp.]|nr:aminopeptidase P family protein [Ruminococcus sp.]
MTRLDKLKGFIKNKDEALLITNEVNIGYFSGFFHSEGYLLVTGENSYLIVDFRYAEAAEKKSGGCKVVMYSRLSQDLLDILTKEGINSVSFEADSITVSRFDFFKKFLAQRNIDCFADQKLCKHIADIRIIKDSSEIDKIQKAQNIAEKAYLEVLNYVKPGVTEKEISARLEYVMNIYGAECKSFDLITITGKKTSLPHGVPSDGIVKEGDFFTFDFGAVYEGYHSDTTRTVAVKYATDKMTEIYNIVLKAQLAALEKIKPGVKCSEVDKTARDIISEHGYGKFFGHATGHGVGLDIHEAPTVSPRGEITLKSGMVITDEPGIYLPNEFGVRIEDMLCVTDEGCKNFVSLPKELIIV